jgi:hypothetical protein
MVMVDLVEEEQFEIVELFVAYEGFPRNKQISK